jgi:hypothetical protein
MAACRVGNRTVLMATRTSSGYRVSSVTKGTLRAGLVGKLLPLLLWPMLTPLPRLVFGIGVGVTIIVAIVIVTMVTMAMLIVAMPAIPCHSGANMMVSTSAPDRRDLPRWRLRISVIFRRWTMEDLGDQSGLPCGRQCHDAARLGKAQLWRT